MAWAVIWLVWGLYIPALCFDLSLSKDCLHGPQSRGCWDDGYDILTDYNDVKNIPPGRLVEYTLTLSEGMVSPDGYIRPGIVINGQFPGPTLEASWGDTLRITVHNNLTIYNGTSIHWHAIRQWQTNWQDGVPGVTQCPIKPGDSQVYDFRATQYGTTWYHSHDSMQIVDGLFGAIVIHGPSSMDYDIDLGPWLLADWYHTNISGLDWIPLYWDNDTLPPFTLLNGKGYLNCDTSNPQCTGTDNHYEVVFRKSLKYKIGLVGSTTLLAYEFWIDGHNMTVIEADLVPVEPFVVNSLIIASGQRYEIIVEADANFKYGTNFGIHALPCNPRGNKSSRLGVIRYNEKDRSSPRWSLFGEHKASGCHDIDLRKFVPIVKKSVGKSVNSMTPKEYLKIGKQAYPNISENEDSRFFKWVLKDIPQSVDWRVPTLKQVSENAQIPPEAVSLYLDYESNEWVHFLIISNMTESPSLVESASYHPMHLHGHDLAILAQGKDFTHDVIPNIDNPARRDTVILPNKGGYLWIAFQINNPGAWLFHCHIASHALGGLSLQFIEQPRKIPGLLEQAGVTGELWDRCRAWSDWADAMNVSAGITSGV
ncbi:multicopper oxidase-domain-containing protein [Aspergillus ambiguus]|uniref:oxidoreductase tpcJ n=1 Tax=Aspergillus ambiguus TaxID=176160 RepID=UPI003CCC9985